MSNKKLNIAIQVISSDGTSNDISVVIEKTGASLAEILQQAGVATEKTNFSLNGKPITLDTHISDKINIVASENTETKKTAPNPIVDTAKKIMAAITIVARPRAMGS